MISMDRIKGILLKPQHEWQSIEEEQTSTAALFKGYVAPLAAIGPVASFIGFSLIGISIPLMGQIRTPVVSGAVSSLVAFIMTLVGVLLIGIIINSLAPTFNGRKDAMQALKLSVYASTPAWLAAVLQILPSLAILAGLLSLYSLYVLYIGLPMLMKSPKEKSLSYTAVVVLCAIVFYVVVGVVAASISSTPSIAAAAGSAASESDAAAQLRQLGQTMEAAGKQLEQAQKTGDTAGGIVATGSEVFGALAGGKGEFDPVDHQQLKSMLPAQLSGMERTHLESNLGGMGDVTVAAAEASFRNGDNHEINLSLTDIGGARSLGVMTAWAAIEQESESDGRYEKTFRKGDRAIYEEYDRVGQTGTYRVLVGKRFIAEVRGFGVDMNGLRQALAKIDLDKLESMKNHGARN